MKAHELAFYPQLRLQAQQWYTPWECFSKPGLRLLENLPGNSQFSLLRAAQTRLRTASLAGHAMVRGFGKLIRVLKLLEDLKSP